MTIPFGEYAKWNPVLTIIEILLKVALNTLTLIIINLLSTSRSFVLVLEKWPIITLFPINTESWFVPFWVSSHCGKGQSWSYDSWIHNYLCNQCLSPLTLWLRIPLGQGVLDTSVTCSSSVVFSWNSGFLHQ